MEIKSQQRQITNIVLKTEIRVLTVDMLHLAKGTKAMKDVLQGLFIVFILEMVENKWCKLSIKETKENTETLKPKVKEKKSNH